MADLALVEAGHDGQVYELSGPEALSLPRTAELLASAAGHPVAHLEITVDEAVEGTVDFERELSVLTFERVRAGCFAVVTDAVERLTGRQPRTLQAFLDDSEHALRP